MAKEKDNSNNALRVVKSLLMGTLVSPLRFTNEVSNKVVYIGYNNILRLLYVAMGFNVVLLLLDIKKILKFRLDFYTYGPVPVLAKMVSLLILAGLIYIQATKGLFINKDYLEKELQEREKDLLPIDDMELASEEKDEELKVHEVNVSDETASKFQDLVEDTLEVKEVPSEEEVPEVAPSSAKNKVDALLNAKKQLDDVPVDPVDIVVLPEEPVEADEVVEDEEDEPNKTEEESLSEAEKKLVNVYTDSVKDKMDALKSAILGSNKVLESLGQGEKKSLFDDDNFGF